VHYTYFCHADDDEEMVRHRLRQSSNLLGPSGLISLEDGAVFNRLHKGLMTPGTIAFHRGVNGRLTPPHPAPSARTTRPATLLSGSDIAI